MKNGQNNIYPSCGRMHNMVRLYANVAVENYKKAKALYQEMEIDNFNALDLRKQYEKFCHSVVIAVVFSAMAIEAFVNNYGAACLGDDFFYDNFDRLSIISKLQLISKFLFKEEFDKSKEYYYCLKSTFSERDKFIHSKTVAAHDYLIKKGYTVHTDIEDAIECSKRLTVEEPVLDKEDIKEDLKLSHTAINAMKKIAEYFDENDGNVHAMFSFFNVGLFYTIDPSEYADVYKEFGII